MFRHIFSSTVNWLGSGSEFGSYYRGVQRKNCAGCKGPSIDEARRDFRAIQKIGVFV